VLITFRSGEPDEKTDIPVRSGQENALIENVTEAVGMFLECDV